jgi:hypothetical protein
MFSKRSLQKTVVTILTGSLLVLASCSEFLNEKKETPQTIELSNARFACLNALPEKMSQYLEGKVGAAEIRDGFDCGKEALLYFKSKTRGSLPDAYTLEDLRNFFGKYFLKRNNVTPEFGAQLLKVKKVLLGGDEKSLTKAEIQKLVDLLDTLKEQAVLLSPHFPVLIGRRADPTWTDVNAAIEQLRATAWILLREVDLVNSDYSFEDLKKFFKGANDFANLNHPFYLYDQINQNVDLVEAAKNVLIGEDARFEGIGDWEDALRTVLQVYKEGLRYKYFLQNKPLATPDDMETLTAFIDDGFKVIATSVPMKHQGMIPFKAIDALLDRLADRKFLPAGLSAEAVKVTYKKIILRLLDPRRKGDPRGLEGFETGHLAVISQEWRIYRLHQQFINTLPWDAHQSLAVSALAPAAKAFNAADYVKKVLSPSSLEQEQILAGWTEGARMFRPTWPLIYNASGRLLIQTPAADLRQNFVSLTRGNLMRALARALLMGYGPNEMVEADLKRWYDDFLQLGIELKAFDPRNGNSGSRSFKEANFFMFSGNGDSKMDAQETFEYVSVLVAGGLSSGNAVRLDLLDQGCGRTETDVFGYPWMNEACVKQKLRDRAGTYFDNMPGLVKQISKMTPAQWDGFYTSLMGASRISPEGAGRIETTDLRTAVTILHYTEIIMSVYDLDHNGSLNEDEVRLATPRFFEFIKMVSPVKTDFVVNDAFLYLVFVGEKPTLDNWGKLTKFEAQKLFDSLGEVSRDNILRVLKVLKAEAAKQ